MPCESLAASCFLYSNTMRVLSVAPKVQYGGYTFGKVSNVKTKVSLIYRSNFLMPELVPVECAAIQVKYAYFPLTLAGMMSVSHSIAFLPSVQRVSRDCFTYFW